MNLKLNILHEFIVRFEKLKEVTKNDPSKIRVFYNESRDIKRAVDDIMEYVIITDFERRVFHNEKKYIAQAPLEFGKKWDEYKRLWESEVFDAWLGCFSENDNESSNNLKNEKDSSICEDLAIPDPNHEENFDPIFHNGGRALEMAFWAAETYADEVNTNFADTIHFASKIGLEAYDYLKNTIGFDAEEVFCRWRQIPTIFMPAHVSNRYGLTEHGSIYELLDDAIRAYVFGAPAAAIAMCRAILEMILKNHYNLEFQYTDKNGRLRDKG